MIGSYLAAARKWLVFRGRSGRAEFWSFTAVNLAVVSCLAIIDQHPADEMIEPGVGIASGLCFLLLCVPQTAVAVRRLHDTGRSAWWMLISAMPFVGVFMLLGISAVKGDEKENRYGPTPCNRGAGTTD